MSKKVLTLAILHNTERILLGMKKRGFGTGRWNGFGGKVQEGESIEEAALREIREEAGILLTSLNPRGKITFRFEGNPEALEVHIFSALWHGGAIESEEMKPQWFALHEIPYENMWPDDKLWLPMLLAGKNVVGEVFFKNMNEILHHTIVEL
jgi:8-oxo-dGTP diphosphatase/2-hydroxy-dATP diphosphatase